MAAQATGRDDDPLGVLGEEVPVDPGLVVVALEVGARGQLDEVAVAGLVLGQRGEVVVELLAALGVAAGVVDAAPPGGALEAGVVRHVQLGADHGGDARRPAGRVEVQDAVHVAVVGDADGRLAVPGRLGHDVADPGGPVEHRVLGVHVQVHERVAHDSLPSYRDGITAV